ncbi:hypothetical protein Lbir_0484 [Legionella birminghamensis]|uniref:Enhanced entry protein EnhB n=1 Tax=Legionella birminghamensis TaxID=28083 RepID=A0A378ID07_9GAMM|nr:hypothetical protein [Legionella birminghamensis]KTC75339.1 hypothetical protein Lbir_0484 [Legionella birminghamensis]STX33107.1 Uncharacterised protein [Legionella birminghamensis]
MRLIVAALLLLPSLISRAENFPATCQPVAVQGETVILKNKQPVVILIHNLSESDLWITHPVSEPDASAGWSSRLTAGNWSALSLDKKKFELSCIESRPGHEQQIPCEGTIAVCSWTGVKAPEKNTGTFWAAENMSLASLSASLGGRGFKLPDQSQ